MPEKQLDLSAPMPAKTEDDRRLERILMAEMIDNPDPQAAAKLARYRADMIAAKQLNSQYKRRNDE
jgi:hypothetical protein